MGKFRDALMATSGVTEEQVAGGYGAASEGFDPDKLAEFRKQEEEFEAAVASYGPEKQGLVEFYTPFDDEYSEWFFTGRGRGSIIPGVRFPKLGTFATQEYGAFLTVPSNIALERQKLGGSLLSNPFGSYSPSTDDVQKIADKYQLDIDKRTVAKLMEAESPEDLEARAVVFGRRQERAMQIAADNPGVGGVIGQIGMSILDPYFWISGGIAEAALVSKVMTSTTKTGNALRFAGDGLTRAERMRIGAATAIVGEAPIEIANTIADPTRDVTTTLGFIALSPLVGGAFGALGRSRVDEDDFKAAIALDEAIAKGIQGTDSGAVGAAQRGPVPMQGYDDDLIGAPPKGTWKVGVGPLSVSGEVFGTPLNYLARSANPLVRLVADRLSWNPNTRSRQGDTAAEAQRRVYNALSARLRATRLAAKEYFGTTVLSPNAEQLSQFHREVGMVLAEVGNASTDPHVLRAAAAFREGLEDGRSFLQDRNFVPGRERYTPPAPSAGGGPAAPAPPAPATPSAPTGPAPAGPAPGSPTVAPGGPSPAPATPTSPEPEGAAVGAEEAQAQRFAVIDKEGTVIDSAPTVEEAQAKAEEVAFADEGPDQVTVVDTQRSAYFGRKSFGGKGTAEAAPTGKPAAAAIDEPIVQPDPPVAGGKGSDYFGRKSFRGDAPETPGRAQEPSGELAAAKERLAAIRQEMAEVRGAALDDTGGRTIALPGKRLEELRAERAALEKRVAALEKAPKGATSRVPDEGIVEAPKPTDRGQPTISNVAEKVAQVRDATTKVIEAAPADLPSRNDLRVALKGYTEAAEAIAFANPDAPLDLVEAAAQLRRYLKGAAMGTNKSFQAKYVDGLNRLTRALQDLDTPEADALLASVIDDLDSGYASKLPKSDLLARRQSPDEFARAEDEKSLIELGKEYDYKLAEMEFNGKNRRPSIAKGAAVGAAAGALAGTAAWLAEASDDTKMGMAMATTALATVLGASVQRGRVRKWEMESPGVAVFAGPNMKGVDRVAWRKAIELEAKGVDRNTIWKETGWGRLNGHWVTEVDEPMGRLIADITEVNVPLAKALSGKRIADLDPALREVVFQASGLVGELKKMGWQGGARDVEIAVNPDLVNPTQALRIFVHELNHVLQTLRNAADGGSPAEISQRAKDARAEAEALYEAANAAIARGDKEEGYRLMDEYEAALVQADERFQYYTQSIEAESRLVERRLGMSRKERRDNPPWENYDTPEDDLWSGKGAELAASVGSDVRRFRSDEYWNQNVTEGTFGPDSELNGMRYWKTSRGDGADTYVWLEDVGDGEATLNWDWATNIESGKLFEDNLDASPSQAGTAFAMTQVALERTLKSGEFAVVTFEGLKKAKPGKDASGHERVQEFLMSRGETDGYVASKGTWKTKVRDPDYKGDGEAPMIEVTRSSFAFSREDMDLNDVWAGIRRGKVSIKEIPRKGDERIAASISQSQTPQANQTPQMVDDYTGLEEWRNVQPSEGIGGYLPRRLNRKGFERVMASPQFRNNPVALGNRLGDILYRNRQHWDERGAELGITGQEAAWRVGRKLAKTYVKLANPARELSMQFRKITPGNREAAKEIVRGILNDGEEFDELSEDAMEMLLDLIAPVKKGSAESPRARPRVDLPLDAQLDADIMDIYEWDAEKLFTEYSRHISGYAGLLRAGFSSASELDSMIDEVERAADFDPRYKKRAEKEAALLKDLRDAIMGKPPEDLQRSPNWNFIANQMRRLNFGNLMNNTGFLSLSEVAGAITRVGVVRIFKLFPEYQQYISRVRAGDPRATESMFHFADSVMGHGSSQIRSRVMNLEDGAPGGDNSIQDGMDGVAATFDRFTRKQANLVSRFSGMAPIQEFLRMSIVTAEAQDWVRAARNGRAVYSPRRMAAMGIDAGMWQRISAELRKFPDIASPDTLRQVPNMDLDLWEDAEALNAFIVALDRNANRIVMEGDVGHIHMPLRNKPSMQLLLQFMSFPLNAFSKHLGFALNTRDMRAGAEALTMAIGGMAGYTARVAAQANLQDTQEERDKYLAERLTNEEMIKALVYYSAHGSIAPNVVDLGASLLGDGYGDKGLGIPGVGPIFAKTRASGLAGDPLVGNPTRTRVMDAPGKVGDLFRGTKFSEQDVQGVIKHFAPLGNHVALMAITDRMLEFLPDEEGSIEDEVQN